MGKKGKLAVARRSDWWGGRSSAWARDWIKTEAHSPFLFQTKKKAKKIRKKKIDERNKIREKNGTKRHNFISLRG